MAKTNPSPATWARRLRQERERAFWDWTLDLTDIRTESQFVALIKEHFRERVRAGFLRQLRIQAGARFWGQLSFELASYFGNIHVHVRDWAGFQQRLATVAKNLQTNFRLLRGERGATAFQVDYDSTTTTGLRSRTFVRYFFLAPKCKLTVPKLVTTFRKRQAAHPLTVLARTWSRLEFDFGLETRTVPKSAGLVVRQGGRELRFVLNANARRVSRLLAFLTDTGTDNDEAELNHCRSVLEAWSEEEDMDATLPSHWQPLVQWITDSFAGVLVEADDPLRCDSE